MRENIGASQTFRRLMRALSVGLAAAMLFSFCHFNALCGEIRERVVRLHVLANSDTEEDQALKLKVRDALLAEAGDLLTPAGSTEEALAAVKAALPRLKQAAEACISAEGYAYPVSVGVEESYFPTRVYDSGTLPAGWYHALRVVIGKGEGHNWWCVVWPPMCLSAAADLSEALDGEACRVVEEPVRYEVRFKIVEWLEGLFKNEKR